MTLPASLAQRLSLPLIAAPMLKASRPELVVAACRQGVIGAFPTANAGGPEQLDPRWAGLADLRTGVQEEDDASPHA